MGAKHSVEASPQKCTAARSVSSTAQSKNKKTVWFWQSNSNPFDDKEKKEWKRYSDFENEYIEEAYQRKEEEEVQLNDYVVNFSRNIQFKKEDGNRQRPVKRELIDISNYLREERFCYPERAVKSFVVDSEFCYPVVIEQWHNKNEEIRKNFPVVAELAVQGIVEEVKLFNQKFDFERMADQLRSCKNDEEILKCVVRLYSAESFLYKLVNSTMRNEDISKVDTLGPFCWLLHSYLRQQGTQQKEQVVYRGTILTDEMIEEYKQAVGTMIKWLSFTSTSKDRRVAELFSGNTLFIIYLKDNIFWRFHSGIWSISHYPTEQEVLVIAGCRFYVEKVERDSTSGKYLIYMISEDDDE